MLNVYVSLCVGVLSGMALLLGQVSAQNVNSTETRPGVCGGDLPPCSLGTADVSFGTISCAYLADLETYCSAAVDVVERGEVVNPDPFEARPICTLHHVPEASRSIP